MRISGLDAKFFQDIFEVGNSKPKKAFYSSEDYVIRDRVVISEDGMKKLREYGEEISKSKWSDNELKYHQNDFLSSVGQTLEHVGKQTENMKYLAILAQDNHLTEEDRLELQKRMTQMQRDLFILTHNMSYKLAKQDGRIAPKDEIKFDFDLTMKVLDEQQKKIKGNSDYEDWEDKATLSMKNPEKAVITTERLTRQIDELKKKQDEFITFFKSEEGQRAIEEEMRNPTRNKELDGGCYFVKLKSYAMLSDVRIKSPKGIIEERYSSWDNFLKDNVYGSLGFAGYWDEYLGREVYKEMEI